ncbi:hypothetical protein QU845_24960, partial [Escherichia coli]|nr:hypothetical protein [Escherichia coli]
LNKALKDGKILQADYNTLMAAAKKDYEATLKKPKQSGVKVSAGVRKPSAPLRYISAVMPQTRPSPLLPSLWPFQDRPATWRL